MSGTSELARPWFATLPHSGSRCVSHSVCVRACLRARVFVPSVCACATPPSKKRRRVDPKSGKRGQQETGGAEAVCAVQVSAGTFVPCCRRMDGWMHSCLQVKVENAEFLGYSNARRTN